MFSFFKKKFVISRATQEDTKAMAALHATGFARGWARDEFADLLQATNTLCLCVREKPHNPPFGFILWRIAVGEAEILTLIIAKKSRNRGQGRALLHASLSPLKQAGVGQLFLEVESENTPALTLYKKFGFTQVGHRKGYYEGKDALILKYLMP